MSSDKCPRCLRAGSHFLWCYEKRIWELETKNEQLRGMIDELRMKLNAEMRKL